MGSIHYFEYALRRFELGRVLEIATIIPRSFGSAFSFDEIRRADTWIRRLDSLRCPDEMNTRDQARVRIAMSPSRSPLSLRKLLLPEFASTHPVGINYRFGN